MKKTLLLSLFCVLTAGVSGYNDHRGINLDSLERVVARWTPEALDRAGRIILKMASYQKVTIGDILCILTDMTEDEAKEKTAAPEQKQPEQELTVEEMPDAFSSFNNINNNQNMKG